MIPIRHFVITALFTAAIFSGYFYAVTAAIGSKDGLQAFSSSFAPLSAFFTALAFFALVLTSLHQAEEIKKTNLKLKEERNERLEMIIRVTRIQASGMRLLALSIEKDPNAHKARRELELMVEEYENRFRELTKKE